MIVVCDTSPLNYLILVGAEGVLPVLFEKVLAPPAVLLEMRHAKAPEKVRRWAAAAPAWLEVRRPRFTTPFDRLGPGELEAIALAMEIGADRVLIDDRAALAIANQLGIACLGTLAVLDLAAEKGLVDIRAVVSELGKTKFHASQRLIDRLVQRDEARRLSARKPNVSFLGLRQWPRRKRRRVKVKSDHILEQLVPEMTAALAKGAVFKFSHKLCENLQCWGF